MLKRLLIIAIIAITGFSSAYSLESLRIAGHSAGFTGEQNVSVVCYNAVGTAVSASPLNYDVLFTTGGIFSFIWHDPSVIYNPAHFVSLKIGTTVFYTRRLDKIMDAQSLYGDLIDPDEIDLTQPFAFMSDVDVYGIFTIHGEGENAGDVDNFIILDPNTGDISGRTLHIGLNRTEFVVDEDGNLDMDGTLNVLGNTIVGGNVSAVSFTQNGHAVIDVTTSLLGDVTGPISETVVGDDSHNHTATTLPETTSFLGADIDLASAEVTGVLANANVAEDLTIVGGTIDNTIIGGTTPAEGTFTKLTSTYIGTPGYLPGNAGIRMGESDGSGWLNIRADDDLLFQLGRAEAGEDLGLVFNSQADGTNRAGLGWDGSSWTVSVGELDLGEVIGFNYLNNTTDARRLTIVAGGETTFNVDREGDVTANSYMQGAHAVVDMDTALEGDVTGTVGANEVRDDSHYHTLSTLPETTTYLGSDIDLDSDEITGVLGIVNGGTGANNAADARTNLSLGLVDNTADVDKPVSTATQTALNLKANTVDLTGHIDDKANPHTVTATQLSLGLVDNTADVDKPVSTATQTALNLKANTVDLTSHIDDKANPHTVTATQVGLGLVENTALSTWTGSENIEILGAITTGSWTAGVIDAAYLDANVVLDTDIPHADGDISGTFAAGLTLDDDAVTSSKIFSGAVTAIKIAENAVGPYAISSSGVTAENYGYATHVPQIYVDVDGRITTAANVEIMIPLGGQTTGLYVVSLENAGGLTVAEDMGQETAENDGKDLTIALDMEYSNHWTASQQFNTVDINGGTIDGTNIGVSATGSGKFSTLTATGATVLEGTVDIQDNISNSTGDVTVDDNFKLNDKFIVAIINKTIVTNAITVDFDSENGTFIKVTSDGDDSTDVLTINNPVTGQVLYIHFKNDDGGTEWLDISNGPQDILPNSGVTIIFDGTEWLDVSSFNPDLDRFGGDQFENE